MVTADIGVIGLAVMGQNLALNLAEHGYTVAVFNRTTTVAENFASLHGDQFPIQTSPSIAELVKSLQPPRRVLLMVKAGEAVDQMLDQLGGLLEPEDIVIDGGNSHFTDTERRMVSMAGSGIRYLGAGISGGEEGARHGPSIMPGGDPGAWPHVSEMLRAIAARTPAGEPCCDWVGPGGSGHFVKMVHNGIEYGDMQIIAEAYHLMQAMGMTIEEMATTFRGYAAGRLSSFLIDITAQILEKKDENGAPLLDLVLDAASQKGTGKWTVASALELGQPATLIGEAVFARMVSALREQRLEAAAILAGPDNGSPEVTVEELEDALYASKIVSYTQGFMLLAAASAEYRWDLELARISPLWRAGCIIRAAFLDDITSAFRQRPDLANLMLDPFFRQALAAALPGWRQVVAEAARTGVPVPAYGSALAFYDGYRSARLPANLIQAQRDYFGAHTYQRVDRPGQQFHTDWSP
jgi:6-phosphogluconate dehydrogenase